MGTPRRFVISILLGLVCTSGAVGTAAAAPGDLDTSYDGDGQAQIPAVTERWARNPVANDLALDASGKAFVLGTAEATSPGNAQNPAAAQFNTDSTLDSAFDGNGVFRRCNGTQFNSYYYKDALIRSDGTRVVAGHTSSSTGSKGEVSRFNSSGTELGRTTLPGQDFFGWKNTTVARIREATGGGFLVIGDSRIYNSSEERKRVTLWRLNSDYTVDSSFGVGGVARPTLLAPDYANVVDAAPTPDGGFVFVSVAATTGDPLTQTRGAYKVIVGKVTASGAIDSSFGISGPGWTQLDEALTPKKILRTAQGRIALASSYQDSFGYTHAITHLFKDDGSIDTQYGTNGRDEVSHQASSSTYPVDLTALPNGGFAFLATAQWLMNSQWRGSYAISVHRPNGVLDTEFGTGGKARAWMPQSGQSLIYRTGEQAGALTVRPDGKLLAVGEGSFNNPGFSSAQWHGIPDWGSVTPAYGDGTASGVVGTALAVVITEPPETRTGEDVEYSISPTPPSDMAFDAETGTLSGTPSEASGKSGGLFKDKTSTYTVTAESSYGRKAQATLELTVSPLDTDEDAIPDSWESGPIDTDGDTVPDLDLPSLGADPEHKDIFVELDSMPGLRLSNVALDEVADSFADAPVDNPDNEPGINLHIDNGSASRIGPDTVETWGSRSQSTDDINDSDPSLDGDPWGQFDSLKQFEAERAKVFHYAMSVGDIPGGYGISRTGGGDEGPSADFIVDVGGIDCEQVEDCDRVELGPDGFQAYTFMHELGHNLGLGHGGDDDTPQKPNYPSVMNRSFALGYAELLGGVNYSEYDEADGLVALDENGLDEELGFGYTFAPLSGLQTVAHCYDDLVALPPDRWTSHKPPLGEGVDFNCSNGVESQNVDEDINRDDAKTALTPFDDWGHLKFAGASRGAALSSSTHHGETHTEPSYIQLMREAQQVVPAPRLPMPKVRSAGTTKAAVEVPAQTYSQAAQVSLRCQAGDHEVRSSKRRLSKRDADRMVLRLDRLRPNTTYACRSKARTHVYDSRSRVFSMTTQGGRTP